MADSKITALAALTTADPANDMFPVVDVSDTSMAASGTTKRISINNILACSPSATLASATITGDLTVDTSTLYVSSSADKVAIGTTSLSNEKLTVAGNISANAWIGRSNISAPAGDCSIFRSADNTLGFGIASSTAMTLNATGLGVGVAPSAWGSNYKSIDLVGGGRVFTVSGTGTHGFSFNAFNNNTNWLYQFSTVASRFELQQSGNFAWLTAPSGTAGTAITFTQAMTLDASGNLLVGTTSSPLASRVSVGVTNAQPDSFVIRNSAATAGLYWRLAYVNSANTFHILNQSGVGVYLTDGATSWTGTSDERLKDIIEPINNAVAKVGSLRSVIGKFKTDSEGTRRSFLIAQDVQAVLPEAVDTTNADAFGVRYSEVIPLLVAAIKELAAEVNALKNA